MTGVPATAAGDSGRPAPPGRAGPAAVRHVSLWNVANLLTMIRLLLVPGFIALMLAGGGYDPAWRSLAWAAFAVAMITDLFDGHLARTYDLVTDFGKIADPIADKAIMGTALICLSALGDLPWWVTCVILGRELGITVLRFWVIRHGVIPASRGGKLKTLAQGVAVGMYVLALTGPLATLRFWVMAVAVVLTVVSGIDYVKQAIVLRRQGRRAERATAGPRPGATVAPASVVAGEPDSGAAEAAPASLDPAEGAEPGNPPGLAAEAGPEAAAAVADAPARETAVSSVAAETRAEVASGERHGQEPPR
ncbi:CDP-diacylglycerol--glycerol-3-phosphate 3-phosphatidyltransferase [Streptomyces odontomachi]|uniref:CDP-diacylglycerol--glycerol-3-phosphate 3-phosphatidyltransferase n=1 Tax=Streptomyces odontomachi TaxID=2944940 RepID=UPI00210BEE17|nr:CDP-diacylglycerol--glycerol-3-phosphate 3-phosphatidyltransferase [Streptomyces sp. ODS25]